MLKRIGCLRFASRWALTLLPSGPGSAVSVLAAEDNTSGQVDMIFKENFE